MEQEMSQVDEIQDEIMTDTPASPTCEQTECSDPVWNPDVTDPQPPTTTSLDQNCSSDDHVKHNPEPDVEMLDQISPSNDNVNQNPEPHNEMYVEQVANEGNRSPEKSEHSSDYEKQLESDSESDMILTRDDFETEHRSDPGGAAVAVSNDVVVSIQDSSPNSAQTHPVSIGDEEKSNSERKSDSDTRVISGDIGLTPSSPPPGSPSPRSPSPQTESKVSSDDEAGISDCKAHITPEDVDMRDDDIKSAFNKQESAPEHQEHDAPEVPESPDNSDGSDSNVSKQSHPNELSNMKEQVSGAYDDEDGEAYESDSNSKQTLDPRAKHNEPSGSSPDSPVSDSGQQVDSNISFEVEENEIRKLKAQLAAVDEEDEEMEEGEIEDDEETPPVAEKQSSATTASADTSKSKEKSSSRHHHHSSSKDKEKDKDKDKDSRNKTKEKEKEKSERRRKHSVESKEGSSSSKDKDKSSKKRSRRSEDISAGDEDYLFVRGASPSPPVDIIASTSPGNSGRRVYDTDPFGNPIYEDELENDFPASPAAKRRRKSRSPSAAADRRRREDTRGNRRPNSGRKDPIKPLHKSDQICAYYMQGKCQKSHEECSFSHNAVPPRKMELCKFWMLDCCAKKEKCLYLHNDFPCKYYHTGLVCKQGLKNQCKFSHKPMNEVTKAVLLKHIETAPKEILGDFPRLNRQGALNLIAKMESKINGELKKQERERDEERRRSRWEQPTKEDENKLQELMEEAGLGNLYQETVEGAPQREQQNSYSKYETKGSPRDRDHRKPHHGSSGGGGIAPLMGLPNQLPPPLLPPQPHIVNNPALANVLATLHITSTTIQRPPPQDGKENNLRDRHDFRDESYSREYGISPDSPPHQSSSRNEPKMESELNVPDNLPPMQRGIFRRIQERELKNEKKTRDEPSDDERPDDRGWYSSDEETDKPLTEVLKEIPKASNAQKPVVDFASVLSAIRKTTAAAPTNAEPDTTRSKPSAASPPLSAYTGRGDVDFRIGGGLKQMINDQPSTSQGPFRDTDFRVPPSLRQEFKDVDLRMTEPISSGKKSPVPVFKPLPTGPANMIDAAINSHPPMPWRIRLVAGVKPPDYNYVKHTLTPGQLALDPRFGPRTAGGISLLPDPASPPQSAQTHVGGMSPANIPGEGVLDPRMNRRTAQAASSSDPRLAGDPRGGLSQGQMTPSLMPPGWPPSVDMTQAALAAQLIAAQQLGLLPFPNPAGMPMMPPNFGDMNTRPNFPGGTGRGSGPPASSWERYSQQQSGGVTPPI